MNIYYKQKKKYEILNKKKKEEKLAREYHSEFVVKFIARALLYSAKKSNEFYSKNADK